MLKRFLLLCIPLLLSNLYAQENNSSVATNFKASLFDAGPAFTIGGGINGSLIPSRLNSVVVESGSLSKQEFTTMQNYTAGTELFAAVSPFQMDYFTYNFKVNGSMGWLGDYSSRTLCMGHEFAVGLKRIKLVVETGKYLYRKVAFYSATYTSSNSYKEGLGSSSYEDIKRLSAGLRFTFKKAELEMRYIQEQFNFNSDLATGAYVSLTVKKNIKIYAEGIFNHPIKGANVIGVTPPVDLATTGIYARAGVVKTISKKGKYKTILY